MDILGETYRIITDFACRIKDLKVQALHDRSCWSRPPSPSIVVIFFIDILPSFWFLVFAFQSWVSARHSQIRELEPWWWFQNMKLFDVQSLPNLKFRALCQNSELVPNTETKLQKRGTPKQKDRQTKPVSSSMEQTTSRFFSWALDRPVVGALPLYQANRSAPPTGRSIKKWWSSGSRPLVENLTLTTKKKKLDRNNAPTWTASSWSLWKRGHFFFLEYLDILVDFWGFGNQNRSAKLDV